MLTAAAGGQTVDDGGGGGAALIGGGLVGGGGGARAAPGAVVGKGGALAGGGGGADLWLPFCDCKQIRKYNKNRRKCRMNFCALLHDESGDLAPVEAIVVVAPLVSFAHPSSRSLYE